MKSEKILTRELCLTGRAPHGARGLKFLLYSVPIFACLVAPLTGRVD